MTKRALLTISFALLLILVAPLAAQAKATAKVSSSVARSVVKQGTLPGSLTVSVPSNIAGTRRTLVEFNPGDYVAGALTPNNGLDVLVGRNSDSGQNWAIVSYYADGVHLFSRGGLVGDYDNWNLVDPSGNAISADDERVTLFTNKLDQLRSVGQIPVSDGASVAGADWLYYASIRTGLALQALAKQVKAERKKPLLRWWVTDKEVRNRTGRVFSDKWPGDDRSRWVATQILQYTFDCQWHGLSGSSGSYKGVSWLKAYFRVVHKRTVPSPLFTGAGQIQRLICS